ncbi:hypothetical protein XELAEV_18006313mg [Xenopus laevis]|uniref:Helix-turn-helix domain-containing protein n=1 Tax=Xenopus laevis TaxID=8355 RepID=A0A974I3P8_XENLA|nr:hypothetical protein XELAEV_18006313mg [Xenopus laevis]
MEKVPPLQQQFLAQCTEFILNNNIFSFNDNYYHRISEHDQIITKTFFKSVDSNNFIHFKSFHHRPSTQNTPYSQFRRIYRNCSDHHDYTTQSKILTKKFLARKYPRKLIKDACHQAKQQPLDPHTTTMINTQFNPPPRFITQYSKEHQGIRSILNKRWEILLQDPYLRPLLPDKPLITYR